MSEMYLTCDPALLTITTNGANAGTVKCASWQMHQAALPMYELSSLEIGQLMAASAAFMGLCFVVRTLLKMLIAGDSTNGD